MKERRLCTAQTCATAVNVELRVWLVTFLVLRTVGGPEIWPPAEGCLLLVGAGRGGHHDELVRRGAARQRDDPLVAYACDQLQRGRRRTVATARRGGWSRWRWWRRCSCACASPAAALLPQDGTAQRRGRATAYIAKTQGRREARRARGTASIAPPAPSGLELLRRSCPPIGRSS